MSKLQHRYVCQECGRVVAQPMGRCPQCGAWNSMIEEILEPEAPATRSIGASLSQSHPHRLAEVSTEDEQRIPLPIAEFSRVLGGGIVPGSIVLVGGDPGIGKSTLLLQLAVTMASKLKVLYISGEESEKQIHMRAVRLLKEKDKPVYIPPELYLVTETNLQTIFNHVNDLKPSILIVDSIQTVYLPDMHSTAGSVGQLRECTSRLRELAKTTGVTVFVIGHVTKEGLIAGPRVLEHIVDTVLYLEGDRFQSYRLLRSVKNRYGATAEVGVFEMVEHGMVEVSNPSEAFLVERMVNSPGSAIAVTMEGTRPLLVEVQALTNHTNFGNPRRTSNGLDFNRLLIVIAVLTRRTGMNLIEQDVIANVIGGLQIDEPAADLAMAAAIASSFRDIPVKADTVLIGEIGLSGELRQASQMNSRLKEAEKLGFKTAVVPHRMKAAEPYPTGLQVIEVRSVREALNHALLQDWAAPGETKKSRKEAE
jgi:DNA repair protein RadA/Sms